MPRDGGPVVFSAHGVPKSVPAEAQPPQAVLLDATCPLVSKVHRRPSATSGAAAIVLLIGHAGHPEVIGTMGQVARGRGDCWSRPRPTSRRFASPIRPALGLRHPDHAVGRGHRRDRRARSRRASPRSQGRATEDICYATTNRQDAVKEIAAGADLVPGRRRSELVELACGWSRSPNAPAAPMSLLVQRAAEIDWDWLDGVGTLGLSAGASAPEIMVDEIIDAFRAALRRDGRGDRASPRRRR